MKKKSLLIVCLLLVSCSNGGNQNSNSISNDSNSIYEGTNTRLYLKFDEEKGNTVIDSSNHEKNTVVPYVLSTSNGLKEKKDLPYIQKGVSNHALSFDGYSTWITYPDSQIGGNNLSLSAWIAPRAFEWDDVNAKKNDTENLTGIISQYYKDSDYKAGFILGYHREGSFSFQFGDGDNWYEIWDEGTPIEKYNWNYITATLDGDKGEMSLYLNGKIINRKTIPAGTKIQKADMPLLIGKSNDSRSSGSCSQGVCAGVMDEISIHESTLSSKMIRAYYQDIKDNNDLNISFEDCWIQNTLKDDVYKTQFHGGPYEHWMNEPHAPIYYNGVYHLFFQFNPLGPYFNSASGINWGHLVSTDMINWTPIKEAITPKVGTVCPDGVWSGASTYATVNGIKNVPVLLFTAGDYNHQGKLSNQNIGIAYPADPTDPNLTEWIIDDKLAVEQKLGQGTPGEFRDAHCFIEDDQYILIVGSSLNGKGCALIYTSNLNGKDPLHNFTYQGVLYQYPNQSSMYGSTWELPVLLPLSKEDGTKTNKYIFMISPAPATTADNNIYYWIGEFDKNTYRFISDWNGDPKRIDYGKNCFTGPSGFVDSVSGQTYMFSIMQDQREASEHASSGWANCVGLPRNIFLNDNGDLGIKVSNNILNNETVIVNSQNLSITECNELLKNVKSDMYVVDITFKDISGTGKFGVNVRESINSSEKTECYYNIDNSNIGINNQSNKNNPAFANGTFEGKVTSADEYNFKIYVDRSLIEFFCNNEKSISVRSYAENECLNMSVFADNCNVTITSITVSEVRGIF